MQIYVGNLPNGYRLSDLVQIFETYGCVSRASAVRDFAFLAIYDNEAARAAINGLNGNVFGDQKIVVEQARFYPRNRFQSIVKGRPGFAERELVQGQESGKEVFDGINTTRSYCMNGHEEGYQGDTQGGNREVNANNEHVQPQHMDGFVGDSHFGCRGRGARCENVFRRSACGLRRSNIRGDSRGTVHPDGQPQRIGGVELHVQRRQFVPQQQQNSVAAAVAPASTQSSVTSNNNLEQPKNMSTEPVTPLADGEAAAPASTRKRGNRRSGRGGRGTRGGRAGSNGDQPTQGPAVAAPVAASVTPVQVGGSGDNMEKKSELLAAVAQSSQESSVGAKGQINGGAGDVLRNATVSSV
ncbi:hypothetical protein BV898_11711 [Hypsibius exemplaris]|uniref:RRM domain-containing protein n=1 Tax=Hypsibius exemplaris TaxID=2072580 RepID=A0A1W0WFQ8_HYPEX|nr:hypothetical protein BV898_11711 [Hypsibius exemplaris]